MKNAGYFKHSQLAIAINTAILPTLGLGVLTKVSTIEAQQIQIEEVIVTASRRSQSIQDIPLNISAVSGEALQDQRLRSLVEISRTVPGLMVSDQGSRSTTNNIIVRGLNTANSGPTGASPYNTTSVATYMGEIPLFVDLKTNDLERIEVLIGPQGTLYGSGTLAGAIRYIPNKPQFEEFEGEVRGELYQINEAEDPSYGAGITLNLPIADTLAARLTIDSIDDSGFIDYDYVVRSAGVSNPQPNFSNPGDIGVNLRSVEDADGEQTSTARLALRWQPNDQLDSVLSYWYQKQELEGRSLTHRDALAHLVDIGEYASALRYEEPQDRETDLISLEITADLGFAELTSATGYSTIDEVGQRDQTDLLLDFQYGYEDFPTFSSFTKEVTDYENLVQELRLVSNNDGPFNWIAGVFYNKIESTDTSSEFTPGYDQFVVDAGNGTLLRPDSLEYFQFTDQERTEQAIFGEVEYQLNDWTFTVGARYYEYEEEINQAFDLPLARTVFNGEDSTSIVLDLQKNSTDDEGALYKFNASYQASDDLMVYFTVSEGYRIGGVNTVPPCTGDETGNSQALCALPDEVDFAPDTTLNKEIGVRSTWLDQRLTVNGAIYQIDWEDIQVNDITANGDIPITVNGGEADSRGIELSFQAVFTEQWRLSGTYSYNKAELTQRVPNLIRNDDALDGDRLPGSPENSASLMLEHDRLVMGDNELRLSYAIYYTGDIFTTVGNRGNSAIADRNGITRPNGWGEELPDYVLHNVSAILTTGDLKTTLYVDNLLDEDAVTAVRTDRSEFRDINNFALRSYGQYITPPRTVGIKVTYTF